MKITQCDEKLIILMASELSGISLEFQWLEMQIWGGQSACLWDPFHFWIISYIVLDWDFVTGFCSYFPSPSTTIIGEAEWTGFPILLERQAQSS